MGVWSAAILGNDTSCEVYERFIQLYDFGEDVNTIAQILLTEQAENLEYDKTNVWFGLSLACWECKVLTTEIYNIIQQIIQSDEDIRICKELNADETFIKERRKKLSDFLKKISTEKQKPRLRKKIPQQVNSTYLPGMCLTYKNINGKYTGAYLVLSEHFKFKGEIQLCFVDFESDELPTEELFQNAKLFGLKKLGSEWVTPEYCGNALDLSYEKNNKDAFFICISQIFTIVCILKDVDLNKFTYNIKGGWSDYKTPSLIVEGLERLRDKWKSELVTSDLTLNELLDKVGQ